MVTKQHIPQLVENVTVHGPVPTATGAHHPVHNRMASDCTPDQVVYGVPKAEAKGALFMFVFGLVNKV